MIRRAELVGDGVADRVGDVDGGGAGVDHGLEDAQQELRVGPGGVLGAELDLRVGAQGLAAVANPAGRLHERLLAVEVQLVHEVDVAGGDEDVQVRPLGDADGLHGALRIAVAAASQGRHGHAAGLPRDAVHGVPVARRGGREAGLDDVDVEADQLARDLDLLLGRQRRTRRLLPVAQGRVEDTDAPALTDASGRRGAHEAPAAGRRPAEAWAWPAVTSTGSSHAICERSAAPTCSIWWSRSCARSRSKVGPAGAVLGDPAVGEAAVLDLRQDLPHRGADVVVDDARAGHVVAVLGRVADAEAHEVEAAAVQQVDDQLQLVQRLEVGQLGLVAGLDERLEGHLDERRDAAAQHRLLAEEVRLGLLGEGRLEDAGARGADAVGVGQDARAGRAGRVVVDGEEGGHAAARRRRRSAAGDPGPWARPCPRRWSRAARCARSGC